LFELLDQLCHDSAFTTRKRVASGQSRRWHS
jgi:hypothetical protein